MEKPPQNCDPVKKYSIKEILMVNSHSLRPKKGSKFKSWGLIPIRFLINYFWAFPSLHSGRAFRYIPARAGDAAAIPNAADRAI